MYSSQLANNPKGTAIGIPIVRANRNYSVDTIRI